MALEKFKAPPLPNAPAQYDPQYIRQLIRVLEIYFSQLDSLTPNQSQSYRADNFYGGAFNGTSVNAASANATTLSAQQAQIGYLGTNGLQADAAIINGLQVDTAEISSLMTDNVYGGRFYGDGRFLTVPYNQFQSQVDQTAAAIDQAYAVKLEITDFADGIYISGANNTRITFSKPGVYSLTYSLSFKNTTNDGQTIDVWFRYNDGTGTVDVPNSNSRFFVAARKSTGDPSYLIAVTAYTGVATGENVYAEIMWRVSDTNVTMEHLPAVTASSGVTPDIPATPSAIVQANFVSAEYPPGTRVAPLPVFGFGQIGTISVVTP